MQQLTGGAIAIDFTLSYPRHLVNKQPGANMEKVIVIKAIAIATKVQSARGSA